MSGAAFLQLVLVLGEAWQQAALKLCSVSPSWPGSSTVRGGVSRAQLLHRGPSLTGEPGLSLLLGTWRGSQGWLWGNCSKSCPAGGSAAPNRAHGCEL